MDAPAFAMGPTLRVVPTRLCRIPVVVAVAVRNNGELVLADAGWSEEACVDPARVLGRVRAAYLGIKTTAGDSIAAQLRAMGFDLDRVTTIVATHLHIDHVGGACDFPNAEVVCTDREFAAFRRSPHPGYRTADLAKTGRVRSVSLEGTPSLGFPASFDLFDDGEIVLLDARGHTRGNVAVALRGTMKPYVHIGDAVYQTWEYGTSPAGPSFAARLQAWSKSDLVQTYGYLRACAADPCEPVLVPSHDMAVFETLPRGPR